MYTEFVLIYVGLGVLFLLMCAVIVLLVLMMRRISNGGYGTPVSGYRAQPRNSGYQTPQMRNNRNMQGERGGVVYCKHCAAQFDASQKVCPNCGTLR
ncbi:MAG: hypothetical protein IKZ82_11655 [Clostridia bacterium]|nr:hypothetical protein [Clostridia bacterium]